MSDTTNPNTASYEPVLGNPLITAPEPSDVAQVPTMKPQKDPGSAATKADPSPPESVHSTDDAGGKVKTAAMVAGAAALANKLRKEAPKVINQLRDRRLTGGASS
jgi:hypothetical protein